MSYTYDQRKRPRGAQTAEPERTAAPGPSMDALMAGMARPSAAQKGRSIDLDAAMKAKMENAFGDLSAVKLYESRAVGEAGAEAVAQGNEIAFAPGMADFSTRAGQERLGHELSHVMSQRSGQVRGSGFLNSPSLEARADREGAMAAAGQQVYTGPVTRALSGAGPSPFAAGAMQAKRDDTDPNRGKANRKVLMDQTVDETAEGYDQLDPTKWEEREKKRGFFASLFNQQRHFYKAKIDRRPWEMTREELQKNRFNPNQVSSLGETQKKIDNAGKNVTAHAKDGVPQEVAQNGYNNRSAWAKFQEYSEASDYDINPMDLNTNQGWDMNEVDHTAFTNKLKNMSRMVRDYPELKGHIGTLYNIGEKKKEEKKEGQKEGQKEEKKAPVTNAQKNVPPKKLRHRLKRKKGTGPKITPASMAGYQPNESWKQDDIVDPGWKEDPNKPEQKVSTTVMSAGFVNDYDPDYGHMLNINADLEGSGNEARNQRRFINEEMTKRHGTTLDYAANHELGHMLNYELIKELNRNKGTKEKSREQLNKEDSRYHITANKLVERALQDTMKPEDFAKLVRYDEDSLKDDEEWDPNDKLEKDEEWLTEDPTERYKAGQINLKASGLGASKGNRGYTTDYGATNAAEFFAEAFADVYQNGKDARPTSIRLVQLYEEEMANAKKANQS